MSLKSQLTNIHQQMQLNKQAFKKNKQNINILSNNQCTIKSNADLKQIKNLLKDNLKSLSTNKTTSSQAYQCVIKQLKLLLKQAWTKNDFLIKDRAQVLIENNKLKQTIQQLKLELQESKRQICEMRLNGYSGNQVNGVYENGNIFNTIQLVQQLVSEQSCYNMEERKYNQQQGHYNREVIMCGGNKQRANKERQQPQSEEESLLLRQGSQQGLIGGNGLNINMSSHNHNKNNLNNNNILSPSVDEQQYYQTSSPSQINQTPNYNYKQSNFQIQNINKIPGHFIDIGSQFISYANSYNGSGSMKQESVERGQRGCEGNKMGKNSKNIKNDNKIMKNDNNNKYINKEVQISLNNTSNELYLPIGGQDNNKVTNHMYHNNKQYKQFNNNSQQLLMHSNQQQPESSNKIQLYLPIDQNKVILKQQIQTFKQHLRNVGGSNNSNNSNSNGCSLQQQQQVRNNNNNIYCNNQNNNCNTPQQQSPLPKQYDNNNNNNRSNNNNQSPYGSRTQQCIVTCSSECQQGIFRSFYLSLLKFPIYRSKIIFLLQQLQTDQSFIIYKPYPKNEFWVNLIGNFLQMINTCKSTSQSILDHLNKYKLIDTLMIQVLKSRVEYLYNDFGNSNVGYDDDELELDQSSLLNGSVGNNNCSITNNINNNNNTNGNNNINGNNKYPPVSSTNLQSMNVSLQNITQFQQQPQQPIPQQTPIQTYLQIFNALANSFDINCQSNNKCFQFYSSQQQYDSNTTPIFVIQNNQQMNSFVFGFGLYYEKSQQNTISRDFVNNNNYNQMYYQYENSVKRQFEDINLNIPISTQRNRMNQSSNLLNSGQHFFNQRSNHKNNQMNSNCKSNYKNKNSNRYGNYNNNNNNSNNYINNNSNNKHNSNNKNNQQLQGSFISQTNYYQDLSQDQDLSHQYKYQQQIVSQNISYRFNQTVQTTMVIKSLRNSQQYENSLTSGNNNSCRSNGGQYQGKYQQYHNVEPRQSYRQQRRQLRQRTFNHYNTYNHEPIQQQLLQTESKQLLSSLNKSHNILSKFSSLMNQSSNNNNNNNPSSKQILSRMKQNNININNKQNVVRYRKQSNLYDQNYILRKVTSVESDQDSPIQSSPCYYNDDEE